MSGEKIYKNYCNDMCQIETLGKEKLNEFINERLIKGKVGFFWSNKEKQSQDWI